MLTASTPGAPLLARTCGMIGVMPTSALRRIGISTELVGLAIANHSDCLFCRLLDGREAGRRAAGGWHPYSAWPADTCAEDGRDSGLIELWADQWGSPPR